MGAFAHQGTLSSSSRLVAWVSSPGFNEDFPRRSDNPFDPARYLFGMREKLA